jgi:O-antigen/teichoic acid export membrane protein
MGAYRDSTFKPALVIAAGRAIALAVTFFIPIVFARVLSPAQFGTYKEIFLIHATVYSIGLGLAEGLFYFLPKEPEGAGKYVANVLVLLSGIGILGFAGLTIARQDIARWFNNPDFNTFAPLIGCYLMLTLASAPLEVVMIARGRNGSAAAAYAVSDLVRGFFLLIPVWLWPSMTILLAGGIAFALMRVAGTIWYLNQEFSTQLRPDYTCLREYFGYTLALQVAVALQVLQGNLSQYVVSLRFDAPTFAQYAVGCMHLPIFDLVAGSVLNVMMVDMGVSATQGAHQHVVQIWSDTTRKLALIFFPILVLLFVVSGDLIPFLFSERYGPSVPLFRIWLISYLLITFQPHGVLRVYADTRFLALQNVIKLAVVAVLIGPMIAMFGVSGAVTTAVLGVFVGKCILMIRMKHLIHLSMQDLLPWRSLFGIAALSMIATAPVLAAAHMIHASAVPRLFSAGAIYALIYLVCMWQFILRKEETCAILSPLKKFLPKRWNATMVEQARLNSAGS